uniref:Uncharacterized protein n=2 Tax=Ixodes scapularis TaxID=6945 RepID=A0A1S4L5J3_IXOSC
SKSRRRGRSRRPAIFLSTEAAGKSAAAAGTRRQVETPNAEPRSSAPRVLLRRWDSMLSPNRRRRGVYRSRRLSPRDYNSVFALRWTTADATSQPSQSDAVNESRDHALRALRSPSRKSRDTHTALDWPGRLLVSPAVPREVEKKYSGHRAKAPVPAAPFDIWAAGGTVVVRF